MPYTPGASNASGPYVAAGNATYQQANNWETQYTEASQSIEQDMLTAFVLSGLSAAKDGSIANKLNLAAGVAYPLQTDNTLRRRSIAGQSFTTVTVSTTYFLDLNPDGSLSWATAHSGVANYLPLCSVTTDGSGNILAVTDARTLNTTLLPTAAGVVSIASSQYVNKAGDTMTGALTAPAFHGPADSALAAAALSATTTAETSGDTYGFPKDSSNSSRAIRPGVTFNGTGSGTFSHGMIGGQTPNFVGITPNQPSSTQTVGIDSLGSTSVHVNQPNSWPWLGLAIRL